MPKFAATAGLRSFQMKLSYQEVQDPDRVHDDVVGVAGDRILELRVQHEEQTSESGEERDPPGGPSRDAAEDARAFLGLRVPALGGLVHDDEVLDGMGGHVSREPRQRVKRDRPDQEQRRTLVRPFGAVRRLQMRGLLADQGGGGPQRHEDCRPQQPERVRADPSEVDDRRRVALVEHDPGQLVQGGRGAPDDQDRGPHPRVQDQAVQPRRAEPGLAPVDPGEAVPLLERVDHVPDRGDRDDDPQIQQHRHGDQPDGHHGAPREQPAPELELVPVPVHQRQGERLVQQADGRTRR